MNLLQSLGCKYGTDKSSTTHTFRGISYLDVYNKHLESRRHTVKNFVEIGVLNGASLRMWQEYFPNAIIHGIDINPSCKAHEDNRIKIHIGDQSDDDFLKSLVQTFGNDNLDAVLDDGSHITNHQIKTFDYLYSKLSDDGIYIIEDLRNSYEEFFNHHNVRDVWPGMSYNKREDKLKNYREDFNSWLQMKIKLMDFHSSQTNLVGIHCYPMTIVFENGGINSTST